MGLLDIPRDGGACSSQYMNEGLENNSIQQKEEKKETYGIVKLHVCGFVHNGPKIKLKIPYKDRFKINSLTKNKKGG